MDALCQSLIDLAQRWDNEAHEMAVGGNPDGRISRQRPPLIAETKLHACASQLRDTLNKHKVGQWS